MLAPRTSAGHIQGEDDTSATALAPGDLVTHPVNARALATVVQVVGDSVAVADDLGTVATDAGARFWPSAVLVALTANPRVRVGVAF